MSIFLDSPKNPPLKLGCHEASFKLAQLAAPFAAAGVDMETAVKKAYLLLALSQDYLQKLDTKALFSKADELSTYGIEGALKYLDITDRRMLKHWLREAHGDAVAADLWPRALKREKVFSPAIYEPMRVAKVLANKAKAGASKRETGIFLKKPEENLLT